MLKTSLSQVVYDHLLEQLLGNEIAPGDLLNRRQIAKDLNVSVAPVLEAIVQLEADGILESLPRKGTRVCGMRMEDLRGQFILREALECEAARIYCGRPVQDNYAILEQLAVSANKHYRDIRVAWNVESEFHTALVRLSGIPILISAYQDVMCKKMFMAIQLYKSAHADVVSDDHLNLLRALSTAEPDQAACLMRRHMRYGREAFFNLP